VAVWYGSAGKAEGYAAYRNERIPGSGKSVLTVAEFIALTSDAYVGLLRYILSHDLNDEVVWYGPIEDPLAYAVQDSEQIKREFVDDYMLRVVDVAAAIAVRPAAMGAPDGAFTVAITDESCPWNAGTWRIENSAGALSATKASGPADLSMEAATFAALYNGFMRASEAIRCGIADGVDGDAVHLADRVLASDIPPRGSDFF
jgi:predicted acetyltransferase